MSSTSSEKFHEFQNLWNLSVAIDAHKFWIDGCSVGTARRDDLAGNSGVSRNVWGTSSSSSDEFQASRYSSSGIPPLLGGEPDEYPATPERFTETDSDCGCGCGADCCRWCAAAPADETSPPYPGLRGGSRAEQAEGVASLSHDAIPSAGEAVRVSVPPLMALLAGGFSSESSQVPRVWLASGGAP